MPLPQSFIDLVRSTEFAARLSVADDAGISAVLNIHDQRGRVPIEDLAAYCCRSGITGGVMALVEIPIGANIAPNTPMTIQIKGMLHTVLTLIQLDFRLTSADVNGPEFGAACDGLVGLGAMTAAQKATILAYGDNRQSRAFNLLGRDCVPADIGVCR